MEFVSFLFFFFSLAGLQRLFDFSAFPPGGRAFGMPM
jgi:hypothetical protein